MKKTAIALLLGILPLSSIQAAAPNEAIKEGRIAFETCRGCHSHPGYSNTYPAYHVPKLGGQRAEYTIAALQAYQKDERPHGTMKANAYDLSDAAMANIAAYLQSSKSWITSSVSYGGDPVIGKKQAESCLNCHTEKSGAAGNTPRLAGQYGDYLFKVMKDYQSGARKNAIMQSMVQGLSDEDLKNISAYFAEQRGLATSE